MLGSGQSLRLAWLHLTNFQNNSKIIPHNFQLCASLPVSFGQILLTGQFLATYCQFPVTYSQFSTLIGPLRVQFWTLKSGKSLLDQKFNKCNLFFLCF